MGGVSGSRPGTDVRRTVLDNGIRVVTERVDSVRSVSLGVWVRAGSRDEGGRDAGISHFLEHVVFKGTDRRSALEIAKALESVGGGLDAFTSREHTCFLARMLGEHVPLAVDVIGELIRSPALRPENVEIEKQVVIEEIRSLQDLPDELVHEQFAQNVWHDHPLKNPVLGFEESVLGFSPERLRRYREGHYTCDRIVVAAAGCLEHDKIVSLVASELGSLSRNGVPSEPAAVEEFLPYLMYPRELGQEHLCIGCRGVSYTHPDRFPVLLMASLLGGGMSSRLYQSVREQAGLAYAISSYAEFPSDSGLFGTYVAVSPENTGSALATILKEIGRLKAEGIPPAELESVKAQVIGGLMISMESMTHRMSRLAKTEINGRQIEEIDDVVSAVRSVTVDDVVRVVAELMAPGRTCVVGIGPVTEKDVSGVDLAC